MPEGFHYPCSYDPLRVCSEELKSSPTPESAALRDAISNAQYLVDSLVLNPLIKEFEKNISIEKYETLINALLSLRKIRIIYLEKDSLNSFSSNIKAYTEILDLYDILASDKKQLNESLNYYQIQFNIL